MNESRKKLTLYGVFSKSCIIRISPRQTNASRKQTQNTNTQIIIGDIFLKKSIIFVRYSQEISIQR